MSLSSRAYLILSLFVGALFLAAPSSANAASLSLSPSTGVYVAGSTFRVDVLLDTEGASVNAAEGVLSYNTGELRAVSVSNSGSIYSLWAVEPSFDNSAGTVTFGGGSPKGYSGSAGKVVSITFQALRESAARVSFSSGAALAADGQGTNVISALRSGTYTITAKAEVPRQEYVAPDNTPAAPAIVSSTHPDPRGWYPAATAKLSWTLPSGVTEVRMLVDESPNSIPTVHYRTPVTEKTIEDLPEGVSYFHIQARNSHGWGKVSHFRLGVDTSSPSKFSVTEARTEDTGRPALRFDASDEISGIRGYEVVIGDGTPEEHLAAKGDIFPLPPLPPGRYTIVAKALDYAGNSLLGSISVEIAAIEAPRFTEYPATVTEGTYIVARGTAIPGSKVFVTMGRGSRGLDGQATSTVSADAAGSFTFVAPLPAEDGVYRIWAFAIDGEGGQSGESDPITIAVRQPGIIRVGALALSAMSVIVPLAALLLVLVFLVLYGRHRAHDLRRRLGKEVGEAEDALHAAFETLRIEAANNVALLEQLGKRRALTKEEADVMKSLKTNLEAVEKKIRKEIEDVEKALK